MRKIKQQLCNNIYIFFIREFLKWIKNEKKKCWTIIQQQRKQSFNIIIENKQFKFEKRKKNLIEKKSPLFYDASTTFTT